MYRTNALFIVNIKTPKQIACVISKYVIKIYANNYKALLQLYRTSNTKCRLEQDFQNLDQHFFQGASGKSTASSKSRNLTFPFYRIKIIVCKPNLTEYQTLCCGHQIGLIYFIQYFQLVFLWNAFGRPTGVFRGRFTWYLNGILEFFICMVMTWFAVLIFI